MKNLKVSLNKNVDNSYPILIKTGILDEIGEHLDKNRCYFLITNDKIAKLYGNFLKNFEKQNTIIIKDGEKYKNFKTVERILNKLLEQKIERRDCIVAFGGGVIGDMAGFCASAVLRGIDFIQIPTTLLSQVDSSVGGKTGFNSRFGKNLVGAFYQPKKVLIDPNVLKTLSDKDFKSGMGEVIKYAFIEKSCGAEEFFNLFGLFEKIEPNEINEHLEEIIYACVSLKAAVVEQDEKEAGLRAILNLGHTFAHAYETLSNYKITHGQAVALGIKNALKAALIKGFVDENYFNYGNWIIDKFELTPKKYKFTAEKIVKIMHSDKKVKEGKITLILPHQGSQAAPFDKNVELLIKDSVL